MQYYRYSKNYILYKEKTLLSWGWNSSIIASCNIVQLFKNC